MGLADLLTIGADIDHSHHPGRAPENFRMLLYTARKRPVKRYRCAVGGRTAPVYEDVPHRYSNNQRRSGLSDGRVRL